LEFVDRPGDGGEKGAPLPWVSQELEIEHRLSVDVPA
jgi:hypothetical protein